MKLKASRIAENARKSQLHSPTVPPIPPATGKPPTDQK